MDKSISEEAHRFLQACMEEQRIRTHESVPAVLAVETLRAIERSAMSDIAQLTDPFRPTRATQTRRGRGSSPGRTRLRGQGSKYCELTVWLDANLLLDAVNSKAEPGSGWRKHTAPHKRSSDEQQRWTGQREYLCTPSPSAFTPGGKMFRIQPPPLPEAPKDLEDDTAGIRRQGFGAPRRFRDEQPDVKPRTGDGLPMSFARLRLVFARWEAYMRERIKRGTDAGEGEPCIYRSSSSGDDDQLNTWARLRLHLDVMRHRFQMNAWLAAHRIRCRRAKDGHSQFAPLDSRELLEEFAACEKRYPSLPLAQFNVNTAFIDLYWMSLDPDQRSAT